MTSADPVQDLEVDPDSGLAIRSAPAPHPIGPPDLVALVDHLAVVKADDLALIDQSRSWTYAELRDATLVAASALQAAGLSQGDRVAWTLPNCAELPIGFLASMRLGLVWLGINGSLAAPEQRFLLDDSGASVHIGDLEQWRDQLVDADPEPTMSAIDIDPHAPAAIAYTSGTTGRPKGAVHSQHNLLWPGLVSLDIDPLVPGERHGTALAHTILNMMILGPISAFTRGSTSVILHRTDAVAFSAAVSSYAVNRTTVVPTMLHDLVHDDTVDPRSLSSIRHLVVGGAGTPPALRAAFADKFGFEAIAGYGLSEAPTGVVRDGTPLPLVDVEIAPDGEVCLRPASTGSWAGSWSPMLGYWRQPDATRAALAGGVLHTGDLGGFHDDGTLFVSGRRSEMILRGGANVSPIEVEQVLLAHPDVEDAAVLGIGDDRLGEQVAAVIVGTADAEDLRDFCRSQLARYKVPVTIANRPSLPRNAMGKVEKHVLRAELATREG